MNTFFIDAGYLIALNFPKDQNHRSAVAHWQQLPPLRPQLVTTSFILDETVTFLNSRDHHAEAVQIGNQLQTSRTIDMIFVDEALFDAGWAYFQTHKDKRYSLTDCISFIVMQQRQIYSALSFDHHFAQAGFQLAP